MNRADLEHLIRAAAEISKEYDLVIVGSQSILGAIPYPAPEFKMSIEADMYPRYAPEKAAEIEGAIGEGSHFQDTHGYYASGVGPETAAHLPQDWEKRLCKIQTPNTDNKIGWCLGLEDLFLSKAAAARPKDLDFCQAMLSHAYVTATQVLALVPMMTSLDDADRKRLIARIRRWDKNK